MEADTKQEIREIKNTEATQADAKKEKRERKKAKRRRYIGIIYTILFLLAEVLIYGIIEKFVLDKLGITEEVNQLGYVLYECAHRALFGVLAVALVKRIYHRSVSEIFSFHNSKKALRTAAGQFFFWIGLIVVHGVGCDFKYFYAPNLTVPLLLLGIVLYALVVGFYEEILFRGLMLDGFFFCKNQGRINRLIYAVINAAFFGVIHFTDGDVIHFLIAGVSGFVYATIYLKTRNLIIPMLLHAVYDMYTFYSVYLVYNWTPKKIEFNNTMHIVLPIVCFVVSLVILLWEEKKTKRTEENEKSC